MGVKWEVKKKDKMDGMFQEDTLLDTILAAYPEDDDRKQAEQSWKQFVKSIPSLNELIS